MDARKDSLVTTSGDGAAAMNADTRLPLPVMLIWLCALAGLALYTMSWYFPGLAQ